MNMSGLVERVLRDCAPGWNRCGEPQDDEREYESPRAVPLDMPPAAWAITGRPNLQWDMRYGYRDATGSLDAPDYLPRGGIVAIDGLAETMVDRAGDMLSPTEQE